MLCVIIQYQSNENFYKREIITKLWSLCYKISQLRDYPAPTFSNSSQDQYSDFHQISMSVQKTQYKIDEYVIVF